MMRIRELLAQANNDSFIVPVAVCLIIALGLIAIVYHFS